MQLAVHGTTCGSRCKKYLSKKVYLICLFWCNHSHKVVHYAVNSSERVPSSPQLAQKQRHGSTATTIDCYAISSCLCLTNSQSVANLEDPRQTNSVSAEVCVVWPSKRHSIKRQREQQHTQYAKQSVNFILSSSALKPHINYSPSTSVTSSSKHINGRWKSHVIPILVRGSRVEHTGSANSTNSSRHNMHTSRPRACRVVITTNRNCRNCTHSVLINTMIRCMSKTHTHTQTAYLIHSTVETA